MDFTTSGRKRLFFGSASSEDITKGDRGNAISISSSDTATTIQHAGHRHHRRPNKVPRCLMSQTMLKQTPQEDEERAINFDTQKTENTIFKWGDAKVTSEDASSHESPTVVTPNNSYPIDRIIPVAIDSSDLRNNRLGSEATSITTDDDVQKIYERNTLTSTTTNANPSSSSALRVRKTNLGQSSILKDQELYEIGCSSSSLTNSDEAKSVVLLTSTSDAVDVLADRMKNWSLTNVRKYKKKRDPCLDNNSGILDDVVKEKEEEGLVNETMSKNRERRKLAKRDIMKLLLSSSTTKSPISS